MQIKIIIALLFILSSSYSCNDNRHPGTNNGEQKFDKTKWKIKEDKNYPYRNLMLKDLLINTKLHGLKKVEVLNLLGQPNRVDSNYLFYIVDQTHFVNIMPLHTKTLVIKFSNDGTVEWRKIHE
ncbi:MAG: hypothetical protein ABIO04_00710 [Ferruginibacter sp.]